jgi:hypothetical protein
MQDAIYTGNETLIVSGDDIENIYANKKILAATLISGLEHFYFENTYVIMENEDNPAHTALAIKRGRYFHLLENKQSACGLRPK